MVSTVVWVVGLVLVVSWEAMSSTNSLNLPIFLPSLFPTPKNSHALNSNGQYCYVPDSDSSCVFPFQHENMEYNDCVELDSQLQCKIDNMYRPCRCTPQTRKRSVLMIVLDDFRPEMKSAYGRKSAFTPVFDALSTHAKTVTMTRAYSQIAICAPSRDSFLSGLYPDTTQSYTFFGKGIVEHPFRSKMTTLPQLFKNAGFWSTGGGKLFHEGRDDVESWNEYYSPSERQNRECDKNENATPFPYEALGCITQDATRIMDYQLVQRAKVKMEQLVHEEKEPFFFAVGLYKPHTPYHVHSSFVQQTKKKKMKDVNRACFPRKTYSQPSLTFDQSPGQISDVFGRDPFAKKTKLQVQFKLAMRKGYQAAVSQSDYFVGELLNTVRFLGLSNHTLVVVLGDHGYSLGENNVFAKNTNFEMATRVPLLFHIPWFSSTSSSSASIFRTPNKVQRQDNFFELVDLLPTVASLMNVSLPLNYDGKDQSIDVLQALGEENPREAAATRTVSFNQISRCSLKDCMFAQLNVITSMGYSVRTDAWRYTVFIPAIQGVPQWDGTMLTQELYSHALDHTTLLAFDKKSGVSYGNINEENVALKFPSICQELFELVKEKFQHPQQLV